jgi:hypothetical protein
MASESAEDASRVTGACEGDRREEGVRNGETVEDVVDGKVGSATYKDSLVRSNELTDDLNKSLRLTCAGRTPEQGNFRTSQCKVDSFLLRLVQPFVDELRRFNWLLD